MAHSSSSSGDDAITGINVTPLVDVMLVLLIIFMVTAKLITGQSVPLDLPKAATAGVTQTVLNVEIDDRGRVSANGQPVPDRDFGQERDAPGQRRQVGHGQVVAGIDIQP